MSKDKIWEGYLAPLTLCEVIGDVEKRKENRKSTTEFEWIINDFFYQSKSHLFFSPTFFFEDTAYNLLVRFKLDTYELKSRILQLQSKASADLRYSVKYHLGFKKVDNSVEHLCQGILKENSQFSDECYFILSEVQQRQSELAPSNTLTVTCTLQHECTHSNQRDASDLPKFKTLKRLNTLSDNLRTLFSNKETCDTTLHVMDKVYKAHKTVLMARSSVFAAMFLHETSEKQTGLVNIPDCDPESFEEFLEFLYTGKLEKPFSCSTVFHLYAISDKYDVQELKTFCLEFLTESLMIENVCDIVIFAYKYDETDLLSAAQKFFSKNVNKVLESKEWDSLVDDNYSLSKKILKEAWGK